MPQLDESRRHGVPLHQHIIIHPPTPTHLSTVNEENQSLNDDTLGNGCHPPTTDYLEQQQQHTDEQSSVSCPQHLQQNNLYLDEEMSGLQSAMTKTALLHRNPVDDGEVITTEEDDVDDRSRRHVGFMNGGSANFHQQHLSAQSATIKTDIIKGGISSIPDDDDKLTANQKATEKSQLLQQLNSLRRKRVHLEQSISPILSQQLNEWNLRLSSSQHSHQIALSTLEEVSAKRIWCEEEYQLSSKWHVMGDVFLIWHRGPFGTINGFRLGKSAVTIVGLVKKSARSGGGSQGNARQTGSGGGGGGSSLFSWGATSDNNGKPPASHAIQATNNVTANNGNNKTNNSIAATSPEKVIIPWNEINSALGQIVFLLYTLQNAPYSGISFQKHILQPCGSASKIGVLKKTTDQQPRNERRRITALAAYYNNSTSTANNAASTSNVGDVTWYNLHHYEENGSLLSMGYYARRNFNTALEGLLYCIAEAFLVVEQRDMALAAPYIMKVDGLIVGKDMHGNNQSGMMDSPTKDGEVSVGGLPLTYDPAAGEQWTVVCKYLLTNLKWLVAYAAKHVDR